MIGDMTEHHVLYRIFDTAGGLLYVGATMDPGSRMRTHHLQQPWWNDAANITLEHFDTYEHLMAAESQAIATEGARYNVIHSPHAVRSTKERSRRRGEGSMYQRSDGLWVGAVSRINAQGRRVRKTVSSKDRVEAERLLAELVEQP